MTGKDKRDLFIGLTALLAMAGVAWTVYHYNMRSNYAEIRCEGTANQFGRDAVQYRDCLARESARFTATKSELGRRKELSEFASGTDGQ